MFINTSGDAQRIVDKYDYVNRLMNAPILISLEDWSVDLSANAILLQNAKREIKESAKHLFILFESMKVTLTKMTPKD